MNRKKGIVLGFLILLLFAVLFGGNEMFLKKSSINFSEMKEQGNLDDLSLTIYYMSPFIFTIRPLSVDDLINMSDVHIIIDGSNLEEYINLLNQMSTVDLVPVEYKSRIDARLYYVFETKKNRKVFDVSMWGDDHSIFVNGLEVKENDIFYDVVMPFLPDDQVKELETYLNRGKQE